MKSVEESAFYALGLETKEDIDAFLKNFTPKLLNRLFQDHARNNHTDKKKNGKPGDYDAEKAKNARDVLKEPASRQEEYDSIDWGHGASKLVVVNIDFDDDVYVPLEIPSSHEDNIMFADVDTMKRPAMRALLQKETGLKYKDEWNCSKAFLAHALKILQDNGNVADIENAYAIREKRIRVKADNAAAAATTDETQSTPVASMPSIQNMEYVNDDATDFSRFLITDIDYDDDTITIKTNGESVVYKIDATKLEVTTFVKEGDGTFSSPLTYGKKDDSATFTFFTSDGTVYSPITHTVSTTKLSRKELEKEGIHPSLCTLIQNYLDNYEKKDDDPSKDKEETDSADNYENDALEENDFSELNDLMRTKIRPNFVKVRNKLEALKREDGTRKQLYGTAAQRRLPRSEIYDGILNELHLWIYGEPMPQEASNENEEDVEDEEASGDDEEDEDDEDETASGEDEEEEEDEDETATTTEATDITHRDLLMAYDINDTLVFILQNPTKLLQLGKYTARKAMLTRLLQLQRYGWHFLFVSDCPFSCKCVMVCRIVCTGIST